ncbi:NAD(P)-dependent oxidoreductase [Nodosilinea sp. LEGE 07298]|uniref:NAD(P)-dependent oxidoreductase n=1 Tax=Nodosilinea sp. LEGE 07298 TaxID=2777970 RepID=UPI00187E7CAB|nr:NAD(P)-dependent oxidoreductase [Nodosilinea sp. LEGE 07298]MBE9109901.1 NAD(P)-dependent oxidoreductase [Nodosilinea sp. LEGE 07298]
MQNITVLGLGAMGTRLAINLIKAGYTVTVWNRSPAPAKTLVAQGASVAPSPRAAAQDADVVLAMVTDNDASRAIWLDPETGALGGMGSGAIAVELSTLTVAWIQALATAMENSGIAFLEAPAVGSRPQAEASKLTYLVGGRAETLAQVQHILLGAGGSTVHHVGPVGQGMALKLAVNALFGIQVAALAELLGLLDNLGLPPAQALDLLGELPIISPAARLAGNLMVANNHAPLFPIDLVEKDFRYVLETAQAVGAAAPAATAIHALYQKAVAQGLGGHNITGIAQHRG